MTLRGSAAGPGSGAMPRRGSTSTVPASPRSHSPRRGQGPIGQLAITDGTVRRIDDGVPHTAWTADRVRRRRRRRLDVLCSRGLRRPPTREGPASADLQNVAACRLPRHRRLVQLFLGLILYGVSDATLLLAGLRTRSVGRPAPGPFTPIGLPSAPGRSSPAWSSCSSGSPLRQRRGSARSATSAVGA